MRLQSDLTVDGSAAGDDLTMERWRTTPASRELAERLKEALEEAGWDAAAGQDEAEDGVMYDEVIVEEAGVALAVLDGSGYVDIDLFPDVGSDRAEAAGGVLAVLQLIEGVTGWRVVARDELLAQAAEAGWSGPDLSIPDLSIPDQATPDRSS